MERSQNTPDENRQDLLDLVTTIMPFGRYQGRRLCDLPETYLVWFHQKGFPPGKIGAQLAAMYEIKANGLEYLLKPLKIMEAKTRIKKPADK
jgi:uncharacterized protein